MNRENNTQKMRVDGVKQKVISDGALVAITLMIAESNPEEKDIMTTLVMNFLFMRESLYYSHTFLYISSLN